MKKNRKQNKLTSNGMKKFLPYILILVAVVGLFGFMGKVQAQTATGTCMITPISSGIPQLTVNMTKTNCQNQLNGISGGGTAVWTPTGGSPQNLTVTAQTSSSGGAAVCTIQSAIFNPSGTQADGWFQSGSPKDVQINVIGSNCSGKTVEISIVEHDTLTPDDDIAQLDNKPIKFLSGNSITINLKAGETECEITSNPDCEYYIKIYGLDGSDYTSQGKLNYDCDGLCDQSWVLGSITSVGGAAGPTCGTGQVLSGSGCVDSNVGTYTLLAPLPCEDGTLGCVNGKLTTFDPTTDAAGKNTKLGEYLNLMIKIIIGIASVLAMVMIVMGGIQYMTSELPGMKGASKERITNAIFGLVLALGAYLLLFTINPDLLKTDLTIVKQVVAVDLGGESSAPFVPISANKLQALGISCSGSGGIGALPTIAKSFIGRATYSQTARNTTNSSTAFLDCSSFVAQVYNCAGLSTPGGNTMEIFGGATAINSINGTKVNGVELQVGDLLGWVAGGDEKNGHVVMYIGGGNIIDAQRSGVQVRSLTSLQSRYKFIKSSGSGSF